MWQNVKDPGVFGSYLICCEISRTFFEKTNFSNQRQKSCKNLIGKIF